MTSASSAFSVRIFIPTGNPEELRIIEKSNWIGQGLYFPRSVYSSVRMKDELSRPGIYILWNPSESETALPRAYVGQSTVLRNRLDEHHRNRDFWTHGVAFLSRDESLNSAHISYLEASLLNRAEKAKLCHLDNDQNPPKPTLPAADAADAELFLKDVLLCLPLLGCTSLRRLHNGKLFPATYI